MPPRLRAPQLITDLDIREAALLADRFQGTLAARKASVTPREFDWYPYDSFGTVSILDGVLRGRHRWLRTLIGDEPVLDIGCGDGAMAFFLESLGARVHAVDRAPTNFNGMRGVQSLRKAFDSKVTIRDADVDARPDLAVRECGLALLLGILYHLKNPFGVLEALAAKARYCLLTTAITRYAPDQHTRVDHLPAAFLAGRDGLRGDETNFWIFTEASLRHLIDRCGWEVCEWQVVEDEASTLWGTQRDERVCCLLQSRARPPLERTQLLAGWHGLENGAWRWTERRFSLFLAQAGRVSLSCTVPPVLPLPVVLRAGDARQEWNAAGDYEFTCDASAGVLEFELERALAADASDGRERGIVIRGVRT